MFDVNYEIVKHYFVRTTFAREMWRIRKTLLG